MTYLFIVNTIVGRKGNIGYRTKYIIDSFDPSEVAVISRSGFFGSKPPSNVISLLSESMFRMLNATRIYIWRGFPQKAVERRLFYIYFRFLFFLNSKQLSQLKVAYAIDMNSSILKFLKKKGIYVVLDLPIAPSQYVKKLNVEFGDVLGGNSTEIESEAVSLQLADVIITPSEFVRGEVLEIICGSNVVKIPFGVDVKQFSANSTMPTSPLKFVCAGALSRRKGLLFLLDAWEIVHAAYPASELHLCGRLYPEVKSKIHGLASRDSVVTPGFVDVTRYFNGCHVYVFPSLMEGSSKSIYEAMASGLPVITTFESGSIVSHGVDGFIIPKCSSDALVEAMSIFLENKVDYVGFSKCAADNVKGYTWERYGMEVSKVIRGVISA